MSLRTRANCQSPWKKLHPMRIPTVFYLIRDRRKPLIRGLYIQTRADTVRGGRCHRGDGRISRGDLFWPLVLDDIASSKDANEAQDGT